MAKLFDTYVEGLNDVLKAMRDIGPEANKELRVASKSIAQNHMVPAWKNAALYGAGPWGEQIAASVRAGSDRVPKVMIGGNRARFSGGATPTMVRYPSSSGEGRDSFAPFEATDWIGRVRAYQPAALKLWGEAVDKVVSKWGSM